MSQIQSLLESAGEGWKNLQSDAARLASKWEKTGLLEGLRTEADKNNMSMILENQAKQLVVENITDGATSGFTVGTGENWAGVALPLVRKVFGQIAAKEFVSVQPMNLPSGLVFYLDFQYGNNKTPFAEGASLYGGTGNTSFSTDAATGGLYGAGRYTYSTNTHTASIAMGTGSVTLETINYDSSLSASLAADQLFAITGSTANLSSYDVEAIRSFIVTGTGDGGDTLNVASNLPALTTVSGTTITFIVTGSNVTTGSYTVSYSKQGNMAAPYNVGDFEAGNTFATDADWDATRTDISIPEINIGMRSEAIVAKTKKLKAVWTPEFAQDLNAYQALDAEAEVTNIMSEYISLEIDLEILDMLIKDAAAGTEYWSAVNNRQIVGTETAVSSFGDAGFYNTQGQWFQTLGTKMNKLSNAIHRLTLRGGANFMVVSPTVATVLESIPGFAADNSDAEKMEYAFGVQKAGSINGRYKVYKNPYMTENAILMGFRGTQFLEAGAVFAPYIPLIMTPLVYDPETFTPRKGLLTRYAKKMLRPEFYGKIYVNGLNTL